MNLSRRRFLGTSLSASAALLASGALTTLFERVAAGADFRAEGYGPLLPDPAGLLDLPAGFHYRTFSTAILGSTRDPRFSDRLSNGEFVPCQHDGMGAFAGPNGLTVLVRNHELEPGQSPRVDDRRARPYDELAGGGTTTLWVDADRNLVRSFPSLSGTLRNCAGGVTPWGSWLSCEECAWLPGAVSATNVDLTPRVKMRHGYVFEVDARAEGLVHASPITAMGRFRHEATAVDAESGTVYLTEDRSDGLLYRYLPDFVARGGRSPGELKVGDLARGGRLEALRIVQRSGARTQNHDAGTPLFQIGQRWQVDWVPIADPDPDCDMENDPAEEAADPFKRAGRTAATSTRAQGFRAGCAQFARTEGITIRGRTLYFCCTDGGTARLGQVWALDAARDELMLLVEPNDVSVLDGPDNLTPAPNGDLIVCEDGTRDDFLVGITPQGRLYPLGRNAYNEMEFAGACFSPDGGTLFANIQEPGITFAIWGPWGRRRG